MSTLSTYLPNEVSKLNDEMDETIRKYSKFLETVSDSERPSLQSKLLSAKLMNQKLVAMTALAKAQTILAEMDVLVAENNLKIALEQLDTFTKNQTGVPPVAKNKSSSDKPESTKSKSQKQPKKPTSTDTLKNSTKENTIENSKENPTTKTIEKKEKKKTSQLNVDSQTLQKSRSCTPTDRSNKRKHSDSGSKAKSQEKRSKLTHESRTKSTVETNKSTLLGTTLSPISKTTSTFSLTKSVQTCTDLIDRQKSDCMKRMECITSRKLEDDEDTVLIEDLSGGYSHRDAINLSKALQKVMPPRAECSKACESKQDDLSQSLVPSKIQLLFDEEPDNVDKRGGSCKVNVKTEVPDSDPLNNSTEHLINGLFKDIMQSKLKCVAIEASNSTNSMFGTSPFCKVTLREILEQC